MLSCTKYWLLPHVLRETDIELLIRLRYALQMREPARRCSIAVPEAVAHHVRRLVLDRPEMSKIEETNP